MAKIHEWPIKPIVTLGSYFAETEVIWPQDPHQKTFEGHIDNVLKIQVAFKYKKPYGGIARYMVNIEEKAGGNEWQTVINDVVGFYPDPPDTNEYTETKDYELYKSGSMFWVSQELQFRLNVRIWFHHKWNPVESSGEYVAIFKKPKANIVASYIEYQEINFSDLLDFYKRRMREK